MSTDQRGLRYWHARVLQVEPLSAYLTRITFGGDELAGFASTGSPDETLTVAFPRFGEERPPLPVYRSEPGRWDYPHGQPPTRTYSVRRADADRGEVVIEFVLHEGGVAGTWAATARRGDWVGLSTPLSRYRAPDGATGLQLFGDLAAAPAIGRILDQLPPGHRAEAWLEIPDPGDAFALTTTPGVEIHWLTTRPGEQRASRLPGLVAACADPDEASYVWMAGEATAARVTRRHLRHERGWDSERFATCGY